MEFEEISFLPPEMMSRQLISGTASVELLAKMFKERMEIEKHYSKMLDNWSAKYDCSKNGDLNRKNLNFIYPELKDLVHLLSEEASLQSNNRIKVYNKCLCDGEAPIPGLHELLGTWRHHGKKEELVRELLQKYTVTIENYLTVFTRLKKASEKVVKVKKNLSDFERTSQRKYERYKGRKEFERVMKNLDNKKAEIIQELSVTSAKYETIQQNEETERETFLSSITQIKTEIKELEMSKMTSVVSELQKLANCLHEMQFDAEGNKHFSQIKSKLDDIELNLMIGKWDKLNSKTINFSTCDPEALKDTTTDEGSYLSLSSEEDNEMYTDLFGVTRSRNGNQQSIRKKKAKSKSVSFWNEPEHIVISSPWVKNVTNKPITHILKVKSAPVSNSNEDDPKVNITGKTKIIEPDIPEGSVFMEHLDPIWYNNKTSIGEIILDETLCKNKGKKKHPKLKTKHAWGNMNDLEVVDVSNSCQQSENSTVVDLIG